MPQTYYDGTKLLSLKDINGDTPEIFICTTNRTGGKTCWFGRYFLKRFFSKGEKFCLLYRYGYELDSIADKFYKEIGNLFFPNTYMTSKRRAKGVYHDLYIHRKGAEEADGVHCGYAIAINYAEQIKKISHLFSDVQRMLFDEFQSETNNYCPDEIRKFLSIHTSIARGGGKQVRYVPVHMIANTVTILNPYYVEMGITNRLRDDTKFLRGEGFVMEQGYVESASKAQKQSAFNRAFANNEYTVYSSENVYLNDNKTFIEKPEGNSKYLCTLKYKNCHYGVRSYSESGVIYCDDTADMSFPTKLSVTTDDHQINYVMLRQHDMFISQLRYYFEKGCFRFKNLKCKEVILKALSY